MSIWSGGAADTKDDTKERTGPEVSIVTTDDAKEHVVIGSRRPGGSPVVRSYPIEGATEHERIRGVVETVIGDRRTAEDLP